MYIVFKRWSSRFQSLSEQFAISDQYSRKNSLLIKGYKYLPKLTGYDFIKATASEINCLFPSLNGSVRPIHIDDAHPLPTRGNNSNKVVIVKFANRWVKNEVLKRRQELVGSGLTVMEQLTPHTLQLLQAAKKIVGEENAWTHNTIVFAQLDGIRYSIQTFKDLDFIKNRKENAPSMTPSTTISNTPPMPDNTNTASQEPINATAAVLVSGTQTDTAAVTNHQNNHHINQYELNYPSLYETLLFNRTAPRMSTMRGMPSRNGRGRVGHHRRGGY